MAFIIVIREYRVQQFFFNVFLLISKIKMKCNDMPNQCSPYMSKYSLFVQGNKKILYLLTSNHSDLWTLQRELFFKILISAYLQYGSIQGTVLEKSKLQNNSAVNRVINRKNVPRQKVSWPVQLDNIRCWKLSAKLLKKDTLLKCGPFQTWYKVHQKTKQRESERERLSLMKCWAFPSQFEGQD